eukprot:scaffold2645_cov112-Isochrysis_galbana.AAC.16
MNPAGKVDHWAFCTILPFRPGPGLLLTRGRRRTTNAGCGRKDHPRPLPSLHARPRAKTKFPADAGRRDRGGPVAGGGLVRCDGELESYGHSGVVESKVVHELNKPRRDEPAACTVANIS